MPPKLPFDPRQRDEPDSDRPERDERPFRPAQRPRFVTVDEMNAAIAESHAAILREVRKIGAVANETHRELAENRRVRELREKWEAELREKELLDATRERSKSEQDLADALKRPPTPLQFVPVPVPKAPDSDPSLALKKPLSRSMRWVALLVPVIIAIITTIGMIVSQRSSPHGGYVSPAQPTQGQHAP